jgi:hypothetical protein
VLLYTRSPGACNAQAAEERTVASVPLPQEVVADICGLYCCSSLASRAGCPGNQAEVMGVPALCATLAHTLDKVIADGGGTVLVAGCCTLVHLEGPPEQDLSWQLDD